MEAMPSKYCCTNTLTTVPCLMNVTQKMTERQGQREDYLFRFFISCRFAVVVELQCRPIQTLLTQLIIHSTLQPCANSLLNRPKTTQIPLSAGKYES